MAAVFFDIDGTLWDRDCVIPESTVLAIKRLHENGHLPFLCSGRARAMILGDNLFALGMDGILAGCGTYFEYHGKECFRHELDSLLLKKTIAVLKEYRLPFLLEGSARLYMDPLLRLDSYGAYLYATIPEKISVYDGNCDDCHASKLTVVIENSRYKDAIKELRPFFEILEHGGHVMELVPKGYSKATGIRMACRLLSIPHEQTFAFGDSVNDCDMLQDAACGIAMGNARPEAKRVADYVTADIHDDGIFKALEHFGLIG